MSDVRMAIPGIGIAQQGACRGCAAEIWWARQPKTGKPHPWNADGTSHFSTCPQAARFRPAKAHA